jgi:peroxiredoxin
MAEQNWQKQSSKAVWIVPLVALAIIVGLAVIWRLTHIPSPIIITTKPPAEANRTIPSAGQQPLIIEANESAAQPVIKPQISIADIIRVRQHWNPAFTQWVGKEAPNFELADIDGKTLRLSSYKGKPVMLVFWATWCPPCRMEIPGLIELRKQISQDKMAILGVSYESSDRVRKFLSQNSVNYTIIATPQNIMPLPYSMINALPTTFFVDKDGIIRLVAEGLVLPKETELILKALDS